MQSYQSYILYLTTTQAGISKPGYPGVIVVEGLSANVNEFVARIKRLNWQALQVRCEEEDEPIQATEEYPDMAEWVQVHAKLAKTGEKLIVHEVESLADVSQV